jgi:hypothetical protein
MQSGLEVQHVRQASQERRVNVRERTARENRELGVCFELVEKIRCLRVA